MSDNLNIFLTKEGSFGQRKKTYADSLSFLNKEIKGLKGDTIRDDYMD